MIEISDNDAATDLWDDAGQATGIGSFDSLLDLNSTVPGSDGYWGLTQTTASDQIECRSPWSCRIRSSTPAPALMNWA
jgi:hypothetical protein